MNHEDKVFGSMLGGAVLIFISLGTSCHITAAVQKTKRCEAVMTAGTADARTIERVCGTKSDGS